MQVRIITEAGRNIGFGHLTRCIALYQAFEEFNISPEIIVNGDLTVDFLLKNIRFRKLNWLKQKNQIFKELKEVDILIIDSYLADLEFYKTTSEKVRIPVYIDDYKRINYPKGIVINPSIYGDRLNYPENKNIKYLLGKNYIILRKEFWKIPEKKVNKKIKNVLITFGGMDHSRIIHKIENFLKKNFNFNIFAIYGRQIILSANQLLNLMLKTDLCISGGGQTTYELARVGVPTIGICLAQNQKYNIEGWIRSGFIEYAGNWNDKDLINNIFDKTLILESYLERKERSTIGQKQVDGKGTKRIVTWLKQLF